MKSRLCAIQYFFLSVPKSMISWIKVPIVISLFLFTWCKISMGLSIHLLNILTFFVGSALNIQYIFSIMHALRWNTKSNRSIISLLWPTVVSWETRSERFTNVTVILSFFDVIEFVSHTSHVLCFENITDMFRWMGLLSITVVCWISRLIVGKSRMLLDWAWLIDVRFSELLQMFRSWWTVLNMNILSYAEISRFILSTFSCKPSWLNIWIWIFSYLGTAIIWTT